ncbi:hemolysin family protein [Roseimaritima ulvae]|uniref:Hemolysin C n=1 Tax=Roseimaritima ulvae TaxID=980254 RepID=A0A5B9QYS6_9BACT|nr:hemolysin family protein [Roseimaritima ulvae]QEG43089.1 Hemolysin C [Roseimaritima ulvae]
MDEVLLLIYLFVAIGFSFLCSIAEAVLLSITPSYLAERKQDPSRSARRIIRLKENVDRPLAAILSLNTIAHTVGAAGVGAQATKVFDDQYVGLTSAVLTLLILVFSEIIPKTIGALHWRRLASGVAIMIDWLVILMLPLVWMSEFLTRLLSSGEKGHMVTRAEVAAMAELGTQQGILKARETKVMRNLLKMDSIHVEDVMTPRTVVIAQDQTMTLGEFCELIPDLPVSRIPVYDEHRDNVKGFVLKSDVLVALLTGDSDQTLSELARPLTTIRENDSIAEAFDLLLNHREHIALVTDDFGGMEGIVTLEDIVETLLGMEIVDEEDADVDMQKVARERWNQRAEKLGLKVIADNKSDNGSDSPPDQAPDSEPDDGPDASPLATQ